MIINPYRFDVFEYAVPDPEDTVDSDYQALLTAGAAFGQPTAAEQNTTNLFLKWFKYIGAFSRTYVFYLFQKTGDEQFSRLNVKAPASFTLLPTNSPTLTDDGRAGNGTSAYDDTQWNPRAQSMIAAYASFFEMCNTNSGLSANTAGGQSGDGGRFSSNPRSTTNTASIRLNSGNNTDVTGVTDAIGFREESRLVNLIKYRKQGSYVKRETNTVGLTPNVAISLHANNNAGTRNVFDSRRIGAIGWATRLEIPLSAGFNALKSGDDSFFLDFFLKAQNIKTASVTDLNNSTGLSSFDGVCVIADSDTGDGKYDLIAGSTAGVVYYFEQGANLSTWTRTTLVSTGHDIECVGIWGRIAGRLVIVSVHSESDTEHVRIHYADTTDDKGAYTTGVISNNTLPYAKSLFLSDIDGDGELEILIAWQGNSTADGGLSWLDYDGSGAITDSANWTLRNPLHMANLWNIYGLLDNGKLLVSGRNYPERFLGGDGPGIHLVTIPADPVNDAWSFETIYNAISAEPALNRIRDHLHAVPGNFLGNGNQDIVNVNYDTGEIIILDAGDNYAPTILDLGLSLQSTRVFPMNFSRHGRQCFTVVGDDSFMYLVSWTGTEWAYQQLASTGRHPADGQYVYMDINGDGVDELIFANAEVTYASGTDAGSIKLAVFTNL